MCMAIDGYGLYNAVYRRSPRLPAKVRMLLRFLAEQYDGEPPWEQRLFGDRPQLRRCTARRTPPKIQRNMRRRIWEEGHHDHALSSWIVGLRCQSAPRTGREIRALGWHLRRHSARRSVRSGLHEAQSQGCGPDARA